MLAFNEPGNAFMAYSRAFCALLCLGNSRNVEKRAMTCKGVIYELTKDISIQSVPIEKKGPKYQLTR